MAFEVREKYRGQLCVNGLVYRNLNVRTSTSRLNLEQKDAQHNIHNNRIETSIAQRLYSKDFESQDRCR